jgi:hypothetical protein
MATIPRNGERLIAQYHVVYSFQLTKSEFEKLKSLGYGD